MNAQTEFSISAGLLVTLATISSLLIALRCMADRITAMSYNFASPFEEAEFWVRALGA